METRGVSAGDDLPEPIIKLPPSIVQTTVLGALLLFLGYALPYRRSASLLLGYHPTGFEATAREYVFTPLKPVGILILLLVCALMRGRRTTRLLAAGAVIAVGSVEVLYFTGLIGDGLINNFAMWFGLLGAGVTLASGISAYRVSTQKISRLSP